MLLDPLFFKYFVRKLKLVVKAVVWHSGKCMYAFSLLKQQQAPVRMPGSIFYKWKVKIKAITPSFLSLSRAPWRKSLDTSSFSSNHMMTNGSNQLQNEKKNVHRECFEYCSRKSVHAVWKILTLDIQGRASGKWSAPCSIHYRATSPWSASSYNLHFYTDGSSRALNIKEKDRMRKVPPLHSFFKWALVYNKTTSLENTLMTPTNDPPRCVTSTS